MKEGIEITIKTTKTDKLLTSMTKVKEETVSI